MMPPMFGPRVVHKLRTFLVMQNLRLATESQAPSCERLPTSAGIQEPSAIEAKRWLRCCSDLWLCLSFLLFLACLSLCPCLCQCYGQATTLGCLVVYCFGSFICFSACKVH